MTDVRFRRNWKDCRCHTSRCEHPAPTPKGAALAHDRAPDGEAEAPERLQVKMWFYPFGTWFAIIGMGGVLVMMGLSPTSSKELWASVIVTVAFLIGYWAKGKFAKS